MSHFLKRAVRDIKGGTSMFVLICFMGLTPFLTSCGPKEVFLQTEEVKLMDSLFVSARQKWNQQLSDTCLKLHDLHFDNIVDSLKEERLMEIRAILNAHE